MTSHCRYPTGVRRSGRRSPTAWLLPLLASTSAVTAASLLEFDAQEDPEGHFGLRVVAAASAPAFWRIFETGLNGDGGRVQLYVPDTTPPEVRVPLCWSALLEPGGLDAGTPADEWASTHRVLLGTRGSIALSAEPGWTATDPLNLDLPETAGFTITWRFDGCNPADPNEYVDIDASGLFLGFTRHPDAEAAPLDMVFGEIYGNVFQGTQLVGSGFDAFSTSVTSIPEPAVPVLVGWGTLLVLTSPKRTERRRLRSKPVQTRSPTRRARP